MVGGPLYYPASQSAPKTSLTGLKTRFTSYSKKNSPPLLSQPLLSMLMKVYACPSLSIPPALPTCKNTPISVKICWQLNFFVIPDEQILKLKMVDQK